MAKFEKRLAARKLRRRGWSILSIAKHLSVSKSTASIWCRDLQLTDAQRERLMSNAIKAGLVGRLKGARINKERKERLIELYQEKALRDLSKLTRQEFLVAGIALYWGEGNKKTHLGFTNSDPQMIKFMYRWFNDTLGVKKEDFMPRISINAIHRPRIKKVARFWQKLLQLSRRQFGNPILLKRNPKKIYENYNSYYGLLTLRVRRSSELKYRILGLIEALEKAGVA